MLYTALLGLMLGCTPGKNVEVGPNLEDFSFDKAIERELRKHGPYVSYLVEQDYSNSREEGVVHLRVMDLERRKRLEASFDDGLGYIAMYQPAFRELLFPEQDTQEGLDKVLEVVDHEYWHAIEDSDLFELEGYTGPNRGELEIYCVERVNSDDFAIVREEVRLIGLYSVEIPRYVRLRSTFEGIDKNFPILARLIEDSDEFYVNIPQYERIDLELKYEILGRRLFDFEIEMEGVFSYLDAKLEEAKGLEAGEEENSLFYDNLDFWSDFLPVLETFNGKLGAYNDFVSDFSDFKEITLRLYLTSKEDLLEKKLIQVSINIPHANGDRLEELVAEKESIEGDLRTIKLREMHNEIFSGLDSTFDDLEEYSQCETEERIEETIYECGELLAREFDEMYSLNFDNFELNDKSLEFWSSFVLNGEMMFGKGISKYSLALKMRDNGVSPEKIKANLEYAEEYRYRGKEYSWPAADFTIIGRIPDETLYDVLDR